MSKSSTSSLEGYEEKDCVGLTFRVTGWPQDIAIQSIYLPKRMSWTNAKEVVHGFLKFDPIVTFAFIKNGKLVEATSGTIISEIVSTFGDGTITVMGRQSARVNKKVKIEGQSFSQIYLSKFKEYYYKLGLNERFSPLESIEDFAKLFKMSTSTMRDHLRGISKEFSKSTYKKILDITNQILDKKFVVELRNEYEQNTEFVFNKLLFKKVEDFLDSLLGDNPLNVSPSIIPSQQELADIISVSRGSIRKFLEENYLLKYNNSDQI